MSSATVDVVELFCIPLIHLTIEDDTDELKTCSEFVSSHDQAKKYDDLKTNLDFGGAKCPKFNIVGPVELDNLELAQEIAKAQNKNLNYKFVDFHSARPGHDLRYALDGSLMRDLGWTPKKNVFERIKDVVNWTLNNNQWL